MTYEDACAKRQEFLGDAGPGSPDGRERLDAYEAWLVANGWSISKLCAEARRRMHERIKGELP